MQLLVCWDVHCNICSYQAPLPLWVLVKSILKLNIWEQHGKEVDTKVTENALKRIEASVKICTTSAFFPRKWISLVIVFSMSDLLTVEHHKSSPKPKKQERKLGDWYYHAHGEAVVKGTLLKSSSLFWKGICIKHSKKVFFFSVCCGIISLLFYGVFFPVLSLAHEHLPLWNMFFVAFSVR